MASHAATMSSIHAPMYARESDSFMRKLTILLLLVINASLGIVLWFRLDRDLPLLLPTFFADACIGLVGGYGARVVYRNWNLVAQHITAILATLVRALRFLPNPAHTVEPNIRITLRPERGMPLFVEPR